ncbi:helix-turn-helix domain-containing protein [Clostridium botulinum]|uniref:Helix-turn-helix domain-containing protein n=1 Tax=Clostridium botulinum TaxID=1491 RepID=A0A846J3N0_CLOBO|nr:helix-turn-helix domain-containing protein [Clostridium botulinum]ACA54574.1 transcriptional regulator [Clostridium botulinum A3 str. Loch Maree]NFH64755.1 helix-turn-helix domain-containing protein [Clostridium botulinum]NFJ08569.1 helix-turn-helix domain-containing protein [Clostridium botulinum]NFK14965.1 helix-turn-helix domain-containing protein [Clostridium botulinum]NFM92939.1 helix-turn-helix domain-containing protein [Clostridium botulinum]
MNTKHTSINTDYITSEPDLGTLLKTYMAQNSMSIRQLSKLSGISSATISRIINEKQDANLNHLQAFSKYLNIPMDKLLLSIGIELVPCDYMFLLDTIQDIFKDFNINIYTITMEISEELDKYEHYAKTDEGKKVIYDNFTSKISSTNGVGSLIDKLNRLYKQFCSENIDADKQAIIGSGLLYFLLATDVIPDYLFPIGYLDDAIAVNIVMKRLSKID